MDISENTPYTHGHSPFYKCEISVNAPAALYFGGEGGKRIMSSGFKLGLDALQGYRRDNP